MSNITLLRAVDRIRRPWKDGGGQTSTVAVFPPSAGLDDFDWRISVASVVASGPFSHFVGVDRTLAVIEGKLQLDFGDGQAVELTDDSPPRSFPGDVDVVGRPIGGEVIDFNLMARRGRFTSSIDCIKSPRSRTIRVSALCTVIFFTSGGRIRLRDRTILAQSLDAVQLHLPVEEALDLDSDGSVYVVSLVSTAP